MMTIDYLSIPERPGSKDNLFHEIPGKNTNWICGEAHIVYVFLNSHLKSLAHFTFTLYVCMYAYKSSI